MISTTLTKCNCGQHHPQTLIFHPQEQRSAGLFTYDESPWVCPTCGSWRLASNCCETHRLILTINGRDVYPFSSALFSLKAHDPGKPREWSDIKQAVASVCRKCSNTTRMDDIRNLCPCEKGGRIPVYYLWTDDVPKQSETDDVPGEIPVGKLSLEEPTQLERDIKLAMQLSLQPEEKKERWHSHQRKDSSYFYKEAHMILGKPWWCEGCQHLNPRSLAPAPAGRWGASRFHCDYCRAERVGYWTCACDEKNLVIPYDAEKYNAVQPGNEVPPPPHECANPKCPSTRVISIWYDDYEEDLDLDTEIDLVRTHK